MSLWNEIEKLRNENKDNLNYPHVYWINSSKGLLYVKIGDIIKEGITVSEAIELFKDNKYFMKELNYLLEPLPKRNSCKEFIMSNHFMDDEVFYDVENTKIRSNLNFIDEFTNSVGGSEDEYNEFDKLYKILITEIVYDEEYAFEEKKLDRNNGLTAFEIKNQDIKRTKQDKKGVCTTFSMRISDELTKIGIPNKMLVSFKNNIIHWTVIYKIADDYFVEDITRDLIYSEMLGLEPTPLSMRIPINEFLSEYPQTRIVEDISDNGKMMDDLNNIPLTLDLLKKQKLSSI